MIFYPRPTNWHGVKKTAICPPEADSINVHEIVHWALTQYMYKDILYRKSHCGNKMDLWPSYFHNEISHICKMTSLHLGQIQGIVAYPSVRLLVDVLMEFSAFDGDEIIGPGEGARVLVAAGAHWVSVPMAAGSDEDDAPEARSWSWSLAPLLVGMRTGELDELLVMWKSISESDRVLWSPGCTPKHTKSMVTMRCVTLVATKETTVLVPCQVVE